MQSHEAGSSPDVAPDRRRFLRGADARTSAAWLLLLPLVLFALLAASVAAQRALPFDRPVMLWLHAVSTPWLTAVMEAATQLGGLVVVPIAATAMAAALWWRGSREGATLLAAAVLGSTVVNTVLKAVFRRARPDVWEPLVGENSYSFPSGHAMATMSLAVALVVLAWSTRWRWAAVTAGVMYVLAVGVSRVYLGVHYPSDVLGGWSASVLWVSVVVLVLGRIRSRRSPS
ncbi:phosphatase PAP2 family protein [Dietzia sp. ANT_WB102]|uniref:phosphatase PAP2 family protein n=1 Tax=Dietzia sp. ANT_WB102 TaxID=2597345 RepID=UPI0011ED81AF|nr:phosphatase PAP2 family protein [Dietzia sp. ANT_WB102]KAA0918176.1 phosphatase PAP2 family protein [Dietzia sp. ANT_WB102]